MSALSPPVLLLALSALAWAQFAFVSESANPFLRPRSPPKRRRWRYGRRLAAALLVGGSCALATWALGVSSPLVWILTGSVAYASVAIPATVAFRTRGTPWGTRTEEPPPPPVALDGADAPVDPLPRPAPSAPAPAPARDAVADPERRREDIDIVV